MQVHIELVGRTGLVMHNGRLADPLDPLARQLQSLAAKRRRTEEEERELADFEWTASLYYDKELGTYLPAENIIRCFRDAATTWKLGERVYDFVSVLLDRIPVTHDGPADPAKLRTMENYRLRKTVKMPSGGRTARTRPIFRSWNAAFDVELEDSSLNLSDLERIVERAGRLEGVGTARKLGYGRFAATLSAA